MRMMDEWSWALKMGEEDDELGRRWCMGQKGRDGSKRRIGKVGRIYVSVGQLGTWGLGLGLMASGGTISQHLGRGD